MVIWNIGCRCALCDRQRQKTVDSIPTRRQCSCWPLRHGRRAAAKSRSGLQRCRSSRIGRSVNGGGCDKSGLVCGKGSSRQKPFRRSMIEKTLGSLSMVSHVDPTACDGNSNGRLVVCRDVRTESVASEIGAVSLNRIRSDGVLSGRPDPRVSPAKPGVAAPPIGFCFYS